MFARASASMAASAVRASSRACVRPRVAARFASNSSHAARRGVPLVAGVAHSAVPLSLFGTAVAAGVVACASAAACARKVARGPVSMFELSDADAMLENADKYSRAETLEFLESLDSREPENPKVMWRLARAKYEVSGELTKTDKAKAKALMEEACVWWRLDSWARCVGDHDCVVDRHAIVSRAVELDNSDSDIHRWYVLFDMLSQHHLR